MTDDRETLAAWVERLRVVDEDLVRREVQAREADWSAEELAGLRAERDKLASGHNHLADAYETGAAERDQAGLDRDVRASERDARARAEHDDLDAGFPDRSLSGVDRDGAAGDRPEAHADRRRARAARERAAEDRDRAAQDRDRAAEDRALFRDAITALRITDACLDSLVRETLVAHLHSPDATVPGRKTLSFLPGGTTRRALDAVGSATSPRAGWANPSAR